MDVRRISSCRRRPRVIDFRLGLPQPGRPLDVGEEQGHRAGGDLNRIVHVQRLRGRPRLPCVHRPAEPVGHACPAPESQPVALSQRTGAPSPARRNGSSSASHGSPSSSASSASSEPPSAGCRRPCSSRRPPRSASASLSRRGGERHGRTQPMLGDHDVAVRGHHGARTCPASACSYTGQHRSRGWRLR